MSTKNCESSIELDFQLTDTELGLPNFRLPTSIETAKTRIFAVLRPNKHRVDTETEGDVSSNTTSGDTLFAKGCFNTTKQKHG